MKAKKLLQSTLQRCLIYRDPILCIIQDCNHSVQFHCMCAICGKDLSIKTYSTNEKKGINMTHDVAGLIVSQQVQYHLLF